MKLVKTGQVDSASYDMPSKSITIYPSRDIELETEKLFFESGFSLMGGLYIAQYTKKRHDVALLFIESLTVEL